MFKTLISRTRTSFTCKIPPCCDEGFKIKLGFILSLFSCLTFWFYLLQSVIKDMEIYIRREMKVNTPLKYVEGNPRKNISPKMYFFFYGIIGIY